MANNCVGSVARGPDFYGRESFVTLLKEKLGSGHHILLAAPRRFGKTSLMYALMDALPSAYLIVHADLEYFSEPAELVAKLFEETAKLPIANSASKFFSNSLRQLWRGFTDAVDEITVHKVRVKLKQELKNHWQERGNELFQTLAAAPATIIIMLDELPMMISRMIQLDKHNDAVILLRWLRAIRQQPEINNLRFVIAGSIGIDRLLSELGEISAINDFEKLRLAPFPNKIAQAFIQELAASEQLRLSSASRRKMLDLIGAPVPYFIQILFSEILKAQRLEDRTIGPKAIEAIYRDKVLGVDCKTYFEHYYTRLRDYYPPHEEHAAKRLLHSLAVDDGLSRDAAYQLYKKAIGPEARMDDFNHLMADLENDFYIYFDSTANQYHFSCTLLRDWWLRYHGLEEAD